MEDVRRKARAIQLPQEKKETARCLKKGDIRDGHYVSMQKKVH